jgi:hypothetical protein
MKRLKIITADDYLDVFEDRVEEFFQAVDSIHKIDFEIIQLKGTTRYIAFIVYTEKKREFDISGVISNDSKRNV